MKTYYVDGEFVPANQAVIPVTDLSVLRGYGVCDIIRTFNGKPYFLKEHIDRLVNSAREIGLSLPWTENEIIRLVIKTLAKNAPVDEVNIRIVITGGSSPDFFNPQGAPRLLILITDLKPLPQSWYEKGVKVITVRQERPMPDAKVTAYIPAALALKDARKQNAIEAIYVNRKNLVLEGTTSNLFAFFGDILKTPKDDVLKGITRRAVIHLARKTYTVLEEPIRLEKLYEADEIFISGTNKSIVPVVAVNTHTIGTGRPGKNTRHLIDQMILHTKEFIQE